MERDAREIPRIAKIPCLGNLRDLRRDRLGLLRRVFSECGEAGTFFVGPKPVYVFTSPELAKQILADRAGSFDRGPMIRSFARPLLGDGLITVPTATHPHHRRLVAAAFRPERFREHSQVAVEAAHRVMSGWHAGQRIQIRVAMAKVLLETAGKIVCGDLEAGESDELGESLDTVLRYASARLNNPLLPPLDWPTPFGRKAAAALARLDQTLYRVIARRRDIDSADMLSSYLSAARTSGERPSPRAIRDCLVTLFVTAYETVTDALSWTFCLLAKNPAIAESLRDEASAHRVWKESLRLFPPVHTFGRQAIESVVVGGFRLRRGAIVLVSPYLLHRHPNHFADPERFDPDRFAPERESRLAPYAFLPFGAGPRACLGSQLATMQGVLILSSISSAWRFELEGPFPAPETLMTLRPADGWLRLRSA